jgi:predicted nucleotide-binding protein
MPMSNHELALIVHEYIGVEGGYLGGLSYKNHAEFYPRYCDLDIDPNLIEGTTRERFEAVVKAQTDVNQARIVRGVLVRFPPDDSKQGKKRQSLVARLEAIAERLEGTAANDRPAMETAGRRETRVPRPTMFIGSTVESLPIAREVAADLEHDLDVTVWNQDLFIGGEMTWTSLVQKAHSFDFALLVFGSDDRIESRGVESLAVRDNVLIEYGLFVGVLGHQRTFFLFNRDHRPKIASDLAGVTPLTYRDRDDDNLRAAVGTACNEIRKIARRLGKVASPNPR